MTTISPEIARRVLDLPLPDNDAGAATVREYLTSLLRQVREDAEGFSGKRPFGNSGWQHDLYVPLVRAGLLPGTLDEYDELSVEFEYREADRLILAAIDELGKATA